MEPIPETLQALGELDSYLDEGALEATLRWTASEAERLVPGLVGASVAFRAEGLTFTLVATDRTIAVLDAVQYATSGPCVEAIEVGHGIATPDGLLIEGTWQHFARACAASGIQSTLTLPVMDGDEVVSTVNLYGREEDTFTGKHAELAAVFGAWAPGATSNADLPFATLKAARQAPQQLHDSSAVSTASGILAAEQEVSVEEARARLDDAARRADVPIHDLARLLIELHQPE